MDSCDDKPEAPGDRPGRAHWWIGAVLTLSVTARSTPPEPPKTPEAPAAKGAVGRVLEYEESPGGRVLYREESGGVLSPLPKAPPGREPIPPMPSGTGAPESTATGKPTAPPIAKVPASPPVAATKRPPASAPVAATRKPSPAPAVVKAAPAPGWGEQVDAAAEAGDNAALVALASSPQARTDCGSAYRSWNIARALEEAGQSGAVARTLEPLLLQCKDGVVRATTLEIARELVDSELLARWVAREAPAVRTGEAEKRFDRLSIGLALARSTASKAPAIERARTVEREVGAAIVRFRDADGAAALGWLWLEARDPATAALWFGRARTWVPDDQMAARGLAHSALQERRFDDALGIARTLPDTAGEKRTITRDALVGKAETAFHAERFVEATEHLARAAEYGALPRYARELEAWSHSRLGRKAEAARRFAALYREAPDRPAAEGLLAAYDNKTMIDADLRGSEPLASMLRGERGTAAFNAGRFIEAAGLAPERYGAVGGVTAPQASAYGAWRAKSGEEGVSRIKSHWTYAVETGAVVAEGAALRLRVSRDDVEAGRPSGSALLGSVPATGPDPGVPVAETRATVNEGRVVARLERGIAWNATLGATSAEAGLAQRAVGSIEAEGAPAWGYLAGGLSREPVRETVLSYSGMRDPYSPSSWGRVTRDALAARALVLASPWSFGAAGRLARLEGVSVPSNRQNTAEFSVGYDASLPGFAYSVVGVSLSGDNYDRYLGNFTFGHGGYFSPQIYRRLGAALDFMTAENRAWIARGRVSAGLISQRLDASPWFPLQPDGRVYAGTPTTRAHDASGNIAAVARLGSHLQLAAGLSRSVAPQYSETHAFVLLRILFEPRASVVSADIPPFVR